MNSPAWAILPKRVSGRLEWAVLAAGLLVWGVVVSSRTVDLPLDPDIYLVAGRSLRDGSGFRLPSRLGVPGCTDYPIGFPLIVAAVLWAAPGNSSLGRDAAWVQSAVVVFGFLFFVSSYTLLRRFSVGAGAALAIVFWTACQPSTVVATAGRMSDIPFAAVASVLLLRWQSRGDGGDWHWFLDGILTGAAFLIRSLGGALIPAGVAAVFLSPGQRRARALCSYCAGLLLIAIPLEWYSLRSDVGIVPAQYRGFAVDFVSFAGNELLGNSRLLFEIVPKVLFFPGVTLLWAANAPIAAWILRCILWFVLIAGLVTLTKRSPGARRTLPVWIYASGTLLALTPVLSNSARYFVPLMPLVYLAFGAGIETLARYTPFAAMAASGRSLFDRAANSRAVLAIGVLLAATTLGGLAVMANRWLGNYQQGNSNLRAVEDFLRDRTDLNAVIVSPIPEGVFLGTGRQGMLLRDATPDSLESRLRETPGRAFYMLEEEPGGWSTTSGFAEARFKRAAWSDAHGNVALIRGSGRFQLDEVFHTRDGQERLWAVRLAH